MGIRRKIAKKRTFSFAIFTAQSYYKSLEKTNKKGQMSS